MSEETTTKRIDLSECWDELDELHQITSISIEKLVVMHVKEAGVGVRKKLAPAFEELAVPPVSPVRLGERAS